MSIEDLTIKEDGEPWGEDGREAFTQIAQHGLAAQWVTSVSAPRLDWPGPQLWICAYSPAGRPTNFQDGDVDVQFGAIA